jgi:hypothetical protein
MSEYQYYEFRAIDRPLDKGEMAELRALSSRAEITPTSFTNEYSYGDFRGDPDALMERYFDAHLYLANWGTHRFMLRLPRRLFDVERAAPYCVSDAAALREAGDFVILEFVSDDENAAEWVDGEGQIADLIPLRADLLRGDLRALYLGWLAGIQWGLYDEEDGDAELEPEAADTEAIGDDEIEPPVPPGLGELTGSLQSFAEFLRIDEDLIAVAAERSAAMDALLPSREEWMAWIGRLAPEEKDALLLRVAEGDAAHLPAELFLRFQREHAAESAGDALSQEPQRTAAELLAAARVSAKERERREAEQKAAERARKQREDAIARAAHLERIASRAPDLWREAEAAIALKQAKKYDQAVALLIDLRDISVKKGWEPEFRSQLRDLRQRHATKTSFLTRLDQAGLGAMQSK